MHDWLVYVPVEIEGRHMQFVLDSGSSRTLIDSGRAKELHMKTGDDESIQGAGEGRTPAQAVHGLTVHLPGLDLYFEKASSVDLSPVSKDGTPPMDGLLGYPLLSRYVVTIDYEHQTMTITAPEKFAAPAGSTALPIEIRGGWAFVAGEIKPSDDVTLQDRFFIDSGSSDGVDHPIAEKMQSQKKTATGVGLGTATTGTASKLWGFRLGPYLIRDVDVTCCGSTEDMRRMFGSDILRRFNVTFDYPARKIFLGPNHFYIAQTR